MADTAPLQRIEILLPAAVLNQLDTVAEQYALTRDVVIRELIRVHPFEIPAGGRSRRQIQTSLILSNMRRAKTSGNAGSV